MTYGDYKHYIKIQVRYKDIDIQGHVNNANHITYFEVARVQYFTDIFGRENNWQKTGMILAKTEIDYKVPVFLNDEVYCFTKIINFGTKSFTIANVVVKKVKDKLELCAEGKSVLVCMDYEKKETAEIPQHWKDSVAAYEKN
jgi:acyl-CoA thioester hydrolase